MRRYLSSPFVASTSLALALALVACGGISDPTKRDENVATVTGALTGTLVPPGAHVALVWRTGAGMVVGADAPVVAGKFSLTLATPPSSYFSSTEGDETVVTEVSERSGGGSASPSEDVAPPSTKVPEPAPAPSPAPAPKSGKSTLPVFTGKAGLRPKDTVSGGVHQPLTAAIAGFIVYADANGNGVLDIGADGGSPDTILGGNEELLLVNLRDGGALDFEKLRDKSGILPARGFNLFWEEGRWLPLDAVELVINDSETLPSPICSSRSSEPDQTSPGMPLPPSSGSSGGATDPYNPYPAPGAPGLLCGDDGYSFNYTPPCEPGPVVMPTMPSTPATGVCYRSDAPSVEASPPPGVGGCPSYPKTTIPYGSTPPAGWPCPVTVSDGGAPQADGGT